MATATCKQHRLAAVLLVVHSNVKTMLWQGMCSDMDVRTYSIHVLYRHHPEHHTCSASWQAYLCASYTYHTFMTNNDTASNMATADVPRQEGAHVSVPSNSVMHVSTHIALNRMKWGKGCPGGHTQIPEELSAVPVSPQPHRIDRCSTHTCVLQNQQQAGLPPE